ncbi:MAG: mechanosensitive ion channel [Aureispira sp.]|nr:mechanosensitive ion channel [Aureispira sp.]
MDQLRQIFSTLFQQFKDTFPRLLGALALIILGWVLAKLLSGVVKRLLVSVKADRLTSKLNEIDIIERANLNIKASTFLSKTIYYALLLIFIIAASDFLGFEVVSQQISDILNYIPRFIAASIVFVVGIIVANFVRNAISTTFRSLNIPSGKLISGFVFYFLLVTISITALEQGGMDTDFLTENIQIVLGGIVVAFAVGFGFSSRTVLKNILAANYTKRKFEVGDLIKIGDYKGKIYQIDSTSVVLILSDEHKVVIPQHDIINNRIEIF